MDCAFCRCLRADIRSVGDDVFVRVGDTVGISSETKTVNVSGSVTVTGTNAASTVTGTVSHSGTTGQPKEA